VNELTRIISDKTKKFSCKRIKDVTAGSAQQQQKLFQLRPLLGLKVPRSGRFISQYRNVSRASLLYSAISLWLQMARNLGLASMASIR
jgi:hypothetical protein